MADNVTRAEFVGSGPKYPGETGDEAVAENSLYHLAGHLLRRAPAPDGVPDSATVRAPQGTPTSAPVPAHAETAAAIRSALRPGTVPTK